MYHDYRGESRQNEHNRHNGRHPRFWPWLIVVASIFMTLVVLSLLCVDEGSTKNESKTVAETSFVVDTTHVTDTTDTTKTTKAHDRNKGHGNDPDRHDEDNPGRKYDR